MTTETNRFCVDFSVKLYSLKKDIDLQGITLLKIPHEIFYTWNVRFVNVFEDRYVWLKVFASLDQSFCVQLWKHFY